MKTLITFNDNWADEMDINSHLICNEKEEEMVERIKKAAKENLCATGSMYVSFGSNEDNKYKNAYELWNSLKIHSITDEEAAVIKKYFGASDGAADISYILECIIEELEEVCNSTSV